MTKQQLDKANLKYTLENILLTPEQKKKVERPLARVFGLSEQPKHLTT